MTVFLNGVLEATNSNTHPTDKSIVSVEIGALKSITYCGGYCGYFNGQINEVRIWNRALTETEIRDNMCKKLTGSESGLVGYWRFDEGSGSTAYDASGNGNNGTLY